MSTLASTPSTPERASALPSEEQAWLAKAALLPLAEAREAWAAWKTRVSGPLRGARWVAGLICQNLGPSDGDVRLEELAAIADRETRRLSLTRLALGPALRALHQRSIPAMLLKGVALGRVVYTDPGLRPSLDIDILVPSASIFDALQILRDQKMVLDSPPASRNDLRWFHSTVLRWPSGQVLDLHWHLLSSSCGDMDDAGFWENAGTVGWDGVPVYVLCPSDQLLHLLCHGLRWSTPRAPRWVVDVVSLLRKERDRLDWDRITFQATTHRVLPSVRKGLDYVHGMFPGVVPTLALDRLRSAKTTRADEWAYRARLISPQRRTLAHAAAVHWDDYKIRARAQAIAPGLHGLGLSVARTWGLSDPRDLPKAAATRIVDRMRALPNAHAEGGRQ